MEGPLELFYSPKFWINFPRVILGELAVVNYHFYMPFAHMRVFRLFFHPTQAFPHEVDYHLVALTLRLVCDTEGLV